MLLSLGDFSKPLFQNEDTEKLLFGAFFWSENIILFY